ncbi:MAG: DUF1027 domain-containing protein [Acholeplasmatales bacterium]|nr:DUF1027 domain-containing protein [Acholeplasmatales bacterium]
MLVKCSKGMFILKNNFRDAFNEEAFIEAYLEECFDDCTYIIGDIAAGLLRLKGFNNNPNSDNFYGNMTEYLTHSCVIGSPYYVLQRIKSEDEYNKLSKNEKASETDTTGFVITPLVKENYDKETLELKSTPKVEPHIDINMKKINSLPQGKMPDDLKDDVNNYKEPIKKDTNVKKETEQPENTQTYVSSSNGFDPSKVNRGKNNFRPQPNNNQNNNQNNQNNKKRFKGNKKKFNNNNN